LRCGKQEALGAADEGIAAFVKAQRQISGASDADANRFADWSGGMSDGAEPERTGSAEINAIVTAVDLESGGEAARAAGEVEKASGFAMSLHECNSVKGFESADENGGGGSGRFADYIEHEVRAVVEKNVGVALGEIHGADARRGATEMMAGGIAGRIGFGFDDAATEASGGEIVDDDFADEEAGKSDGARGKVGTLQGMDYKFCRGRFGGGRCGGHEIASQRERMRCQSSGDRRS